MVQGALGVVSGTGGIGCGEWYRGPWGVVSGIGGLGVW